MLAEETCKFIIFTVFGVLYPHLSAYIKVKCRVKSVG